MTLDGANHGTAPAGPIVEGMAPDEPSEAGGDSGVDTKTSDDYYDRKARKVCTKCGRPTVGSKQLCRRHYRLQRRADNRYKAKERSRNRSRGLCAYCPTKTGDRYACARCELKRGRLRGGDSGVDTRADSTRRDSDGRLRHHGTGKRGNQPTSTKVAWDLKMAIRELTAALEENEILASRVDLPRDQREAAMLVVSTRVSLANRTLAEVLDYVRHEERGARAEEVRSKARARSQQERIRDAAAMAPKMRGR